MNFSFQKAQKNILEEIINYEKEMKCLKTVKDLIAFNRT